MGRYSFMQCNATQCNGRYCWNLFVWGEPERRRTSYFNFGGLGPEIMRTKEERANERTRVNDSTAVCSRGMRQQESSKRIRAHPHFILFYPDEEDKRRVYPHDPPERIIFIILIIHSFFWGENKVIQVEHRGELNRSIHPSCFVSLNVYIKVKHVGRSFPGTRRWWWRLWQLWRRKQLWNQVYNIEKTKKQEQNVEIIIELKCKWIRRSLRGFGFIGFRRLFVQFNLRSAE